MKVKNSETTKLKGLQEALQHSWHAPPHLGCVFARLPHILSFQLLQSLFVLLPESFLPVANLNPFCCNLYLVTLVSCVRTVENGLSLQSMQYFQISEDLTLSLPSSLHIALFSLPYHWSLSPNMIRAVLKRNLSLFGETYRSLGQKYQKKFSLLGINYVLESTPTAPSKAGIGE